MINRITSHDRAAFALYFDSDVALSFIWGAYTHSDNYEGLEVSDVSYKGVVIPEPLSSTTVEVMASGPDRFIAWFEDRYEANPAGYLPVNDIPALIAATEAWIADNAVTNNDPKGQGEPTQ